MRHHNEHAGLQEHSVGSLYPWSIKRVGDKYQQPFHCITGEHGPAFYLTHYPYPEIDSAYRAAERWVERQSEES